MKAITCIRLATYAMFLAAICLVYHWPRVMPAPYLLGEVDQVKLDARRDYLENYGEVMKALDAIPRHKDFRDTRMSGIQVIATAITAAKSDYTNLNNYREPEISLGEEKGKLVWYVTFREKQTDYKVSIAGGFFTIVIDDQTGQVTEIAPGM